jgi:hypothetical protein
MMEADSQCLGSRIKNFVADVGITVNVGPIVTVIKRSNVNDNSWRNLRQLGVDVGQTVIADPIVIVDPTAVVVSQ